MAARAGAHVVASVGRPERGAGLRELGAAEVLSGSAVPDEPVFGVLDNVGGAVLAEAFARLEDGGLALSIGMAARADTVIDFEQMRMRGGIRRLEPFTVSGPFGPDTGYLVDLLNGGALDPQIGWHGSWDRVHEAVDMLFSRRVHGKAVLTIG
ncbi:zinc-binding dehydrogenase [Nocardia sp. NPDC049707]|uniref:zinc-binding dehydrogenase n=1 Tax=Nocardia sp. NPDC049707 TaxID=3154735 RepID=UPI003445B6DC